MAWPDLPPRGSGATVSRANEVRCAPGRLAICKMALTRIADGPILPSALTWVPSYPCKEDVIPIRDERWREQQRMKTRRITLHVFLVLVTVTVAALWTTRSHANSHPIVASFDEAPMVVYEGEQPNNTGEP